MTFQWLVSETKLKVQNPSKPGLALYVLSNLKQGTLKRKYFEGNQNISGNFLKNSFVDFFYLFSFFFNLLNLQPHLWITSFLPKIVLFKGSIFFWK